MAKRRTTYTDEGDGLEPDMVSDDPILPTDDVVANAAEVPLFASSSFANSKSIAKLKLVKLDNPGAGYKGEIPTNSTLETIGQLFGDGLYNIEAVNSAGRRLRVLENQRIALGMGPNDAKAVQERTPVQPTSDVDRIERLALKSANESVEQARAFRDLVVATTNASAAREREFMQGVQAQSQAFMASLMTTQSSGFAQLLTLMQTGHQQTVELLGAARRNSEGDGGEKLIAMFLQGMNTGRGMESQDPEPFWQELLRGGANLLTGAKQAQLAAVNPTPTEALQHAPKGAQKLRRLLVAMRKRGIDSDQLLGMLERGATQPASEPEVDSEDDSDLDGEEVGPGQSVFFGSGDTQGNTQ
jgi:hypothetical protein